MNSIRQYCTAVEPQLPAAAVLLFQQMMRDITTAGVVGLDPVGQVGVVLFLSGLHKQHHTAVHCCLLQCCCFSR